MEISEEGKVLLEDNIDSDSTDSDEIKMDAVKEPVIYTKTAGRESGNADNLQSSFDAKA